MPPYFWYFSRTASIFSFAVLRHVKILKMRKIIQTFNQRLTAREKEILLYIREGMRTHQIAEKLCISKNTVANHRKNVIRKRGGRSIREIMAANIAEILK